MADTNETAREKLLREAARDIPLMRENIAAGYMPEASQAVIDEYQRQLAAPIPSTPTVEKCETVTGGERLTMSDGATWFHPFNGGAPVREK